MSVDTAKVDVAKANSAKVKAAKVVKYAPVPTGMDPEAPETVSLRRAHAADAPALALVGAATFLEAFTWMLPGADILAHCTKNHSVEWYAGYLMRPDTRITLAMAGPWPQQEAPVGYAMLATPDLPTFAVRDTDIELKRIYLFTRFRTKHVAVLNTLGKPILGLRTGQALMDAAVMDAKEMGRKRLLLGTHIGNERAIQFYKRNGFRVAGTRTFQVGAQECCDVIMAKPL